jgi:hypothetical protein
MAVERTKQIAQRRQRNGADGSRGPLADFKNIVLFQLLMQLVNENICIIDAA